MDFRSVLCKILLMVISRPFTTAVADDRAQLEDRLTVYVRNTLGYIQTVRDFCDQEPKWTSDRRAERKKMRDISENQQEEELGAVLKDTLEGLEKLEPFLDAVEKLTVTSSHVFSGQIFLLWGESPEGVQSVIEDARIDAPLLIHFKRDAETFFRPLLDNVNILIFQLDNYVLETEQLCNRMRSSVSRGDIYKPKTDQPSVRLILNTRVNEINQMFHHLKQLYRIRRNEHTRLAFLFQDNAQKFIDVFSERHTRMWQLLSDLEDTAVHLDRMKKGASISTVTGSSLGIVGGVLSFLGIVLVPISAGASLGLTVAGASLGGVGAVDALVTDSTEMAVNSQLEQKAQSYIKSYMDDMIEIEDCLTKAVNSEGPLVPPGSADPHKTIHLTLEVMRGFGNVLDAAAAIPVYKSENAIQAAAVELRRAHDVPEVAVYLSRTEQLATAKMLKFATVARRTTGFLNFLSIVLDIYSINKESKSLAKGSESEVSKRIRSRAALWKSELEAWEEMYDSLRKGIETINETRDTLEKPFLHLLNYYRSRFPY